MLKEVVVGWQEVRWIRQKRQNFIAQFTQLLKLCCMTCGWALSWERIGPFLLTNASCRCCSFQCISSICWAYFSDVMASLGFKKLYRMRPAADHQTVTMTFFGTRLALGSALELLLCPTAKVPFAGCYMQSTFRCTSDQEMVYCCFIE